MLDPLEGWKATAPVHGVTQGFIDHGVTSVLSSARHCLLTLSKILPFCSGCSEVFRLQLAAGAAGEVPPAEWIDKEFVVLVEGDAPSWLWARCSTAASCCHHLHSFIPTMWHEGVAGSRDQQCHHRSGKGEE